MTPFTYKSLTMGDLIHSVATIKIDHDGSVTVLQTSCPVIFMSVRRAGASGFGASGTYMHFTLYVKGQLITTFILDTDFDRLFKRP